MFLETVGRLLGVIDYHVLKKNPYTWDVAESTKDLDAASVGARDSGAGGAG